jgi:hypothetical protein
MFGNQKLSPALLYTLLGALLLVVALPLLSPAPVTADGPTVTYTYDDAGRLVEADYGGVQIVYDYDNAGNLLTRKVEFEKLYLPLVLRNHGS